MNIVIPESKGRENISTVQKYIFEIFISHSWSLSIVRKNWIAMSMFNFMFWCFSQTDSSTLSADSSSMTLQVGVHFVDPGKTSMLNWKFGRCFLFKWMMFRLFFVSSHGCVHHYIGCFDDNLYHDLPSKNSNEKKDLTKTGCDRAVANESKLCSMNLPKHMPSFNFWGACMIGR